LQTVPGPGLDALAHRIVDVDRDVDVFGFVNGQTLFEFQRRVANDRELLGWDAVPFGRVAVAAKGCADLAVFPGGENYVSDDVPGQSPLEYAPVHHFHS